MPHTIIVPHVGIESIKQITRNGVEYWSARELAPLLGYKAWRRFAEAIVRAMEICVIAGQDVSKHFVAQSTAVTIGAGHEREIVDYRLTRYAAHLTLACADAKKPEVAQALAYITLAFLSSSIDYGLAADTLGIAIRQNIAVTKEEKTIGTIARAFGHLRSKRQYRVRHFSIDLYFPDLKIAVECDEYGHRHYPVAVEINRQRAIENALGCRFVRFNPDDQRFHIGDVINQIMMLVYGGEKVTP